MATANKELIFTSGDYSNKLAPMGKDAIVAAIGVSSLLTGINSPEVEPRWRSEDSNSPGGRYEAFKHEWKNYTSANQRQTQGSKSPAYIATLRRRGIVEIIGMLDALNQHADGPDIAVYTYPIAVGLNSLGVSLIEANSEGVTRELLRRLRNTILDGGWNSYRDPAARQSLKDALTFLGNEETVTKADLDRLTNTLVQNGLHPLILPVFEYDLTDGEAETEEVPD